MFDDDSFLDFLCLLIFSVIDGIVNCVTDGTINGDAICDVSCNNGVIFADEADVGRRDVAIDNAFIVVFDDGGEEMDILSINKVTERDVDYGHREHI
ncbi:hypothetical protein NDU88_005693 [Pleurodeles waltl]|uniref:Uncharacterized protein n=1 Tax=Pleurodeles waltl TaxID=8319 RepID=A0AAV7RKX5_PLEWA|nr:hypothetical protein NDU88_005693 [Pleurodeles waltl]